MKVNVHRSKLELEAGLAQIEASPKEVGTLAMIVRRPRVNERERLYEAVVDVAVGLVGDNWQTRGSKRTADGSAHPEMQLNIMNARAIDLLTGSKELWSLAGDQFYVDFDLSEANVPAGTRIAIGETIIEITPMPHAGCKKFAERFGVEAVKFVNSDVGKSLHLRGICARVVKGGVVREGDTITKL
jgi:hypothetical protein